MRSYQREAVERIYKFFNSDLNKAKIFMFAGFGKNAIIAVAIAEIWFETENIRYMKYGYVWKW